MTSADVHGPIDVVVFEMPVSGATGAIAESVFDLVDSGIIRLYDVMVVAKDEDGTVTEIDVSTLDGEITIAQFSGARSGLVGADDLDDAAALLEAGRMGVVLVYENAWAIPFVAAARESGAELIATSRLSAQDIMDTLDALETEG
jgi:Family of unknown function (DUF6325)